MQRDEPSSLTVVCPRCGAGLNVSNAQQCWLCGLGIQQGERRETAGAPAAQPTRPARMGTFSLASLMMFVTLACVLLGVCTIAPGVGIPLAIVAPLAFVRTAILIQRRTTLGHRPHAVERAILFAASMGVVILAGLAAIIAIFATCLGVAGFGLLPAMRDVDIVLPTSIALATFIGLCLGGLVFIWLSKLSWRAWRVWVVVCALVTTVAWLIVIIWK